MLAYLYGFILRRLQGEAGFLSDSQDSPLPVSRRFRKELRDRLA